MQFVNTMDCARRKFTCHSFFNIKGHYLLFRINQFNLPQIEVDFCHGLSFVILVASSPVLARTVPVSSRTPPIHGNCWPDARRRQSENRCGLPYSDSPGQ